MKQILLTLTMVAAAAAATYSQKPEDVLATAGGATIKTKDLSEDLRKVIDGMPEFTRSLRAEIRDQLIGQRVLDLEAAALNTTTDKVIGAERRKVPDPSEAEIAKATEANAQALAAFMPKEARERVIAFLRSEPEQKAVADLVARLRAKYKVTLGKDINSPAFAPTDVIATVNGKPVTIAEYDEYAKDDLYEARAQLAELILEELDGRLMDLLVPIEAKSLGIDAGELMAREITNKMKTYTDEEREGLEEALRDRLLKKYQAKVLYKMPEPPVYKIATEGSPSDGPAAAPVTVVMFSDFQCSACAATHPVIKQLMGEYPGKIRLVVRNYPIDAIHPNARTAARAAAAAHAQGKFFPFIELLYKNQQSLDEASLLRYAGMAGLNVDQFKLDSNAERTADVIRRDIADANAVRVDGTPTIFVNGIRLRELSYPAIKALIDRALVK